MPKKRKSPTIFNVLGFEPLKNGSFYGSVIFSLIFVIIAVFNTKNLYKIIMLLTPLIFTVLLTLIGLGSTIYAIIWGFSQQEVVTILFKIPDNKNSKYSLYQTTIATFGYTVLIYIYALLIVSCVYIVSLLAPILNISVSDDLSFIFNSFALFWIIVSISYSLMLFKDTIHSTFSFIDMYRILLEHGDKSNNKKYPRS